MRISPARGRPDGLWVFDDPRMAVAGAVVGALILALLGAGVLWKRRKARKGRR